VSAPRLPTGTVTFLFTDIEGSTRLWQRHPEAAVAEAAWTEGASRLLEETVARARKLLDSSSA
jgi:class 3 adenylate cyclase